MPNQFYVNQPSHSVVLQVEGCSICRGAHESGRCIPLDDIAQEVNYMGGTKIGQDSMHVDIHLFNKVQIITSNKGSGGPIRGINSTRTRVDHLIGLNNKSLASMI